MLFRTYAEFYETLSHELSDYNVLLGVNKDPLNGPTVIITHRESNVVAADGETIVLSTTYDLVIAQKRAAFTNRKVIELLEGGVRYSSYDEPSGLHIFTATITLFGPRSLPDDE